MTETVIARGCAAAVVMVLEAPGRGRMAGCAFGVMVLGCRGRGGRGSRYALDGHGLGSAVAEAVMFVGEVPEAVVFVGEVPEAVEFVGEVAEVVMVRWARWLRR